MSSNHGTKVTTDPESLTHPKTEGAGTITSDSLAGESLSAGGAFAANTHAAASGVPSKATTTNTTDVSNATRLDPAPDAEARQAAEGWNESAQLNAGRGLVSNNAVFGSRGTSGVAGTRAGVSEGEEVLAGLQKPKGTGLKEGGFSSEDPNASFGAGIGGKNDPGREAVKGMQRSAAEVGGATGERQGGVSGDGQFDVLKDASA